MSVTTTHPPVRARRALATALVLATALAGLGLLASPADAAVLRPTSTTIACTPSTVGADAPVRCTVTVRDVGAGTRTTPTGTVAVNGGDAITVSPPCTLAASGTGTATCGVTLLYLTGGTRLVTATYSSGDLSHLPSLTLLPATVRVVAATSPVVWSPQTGPLTVGMQVDIYGAGCTPSGAAYAGQFVAQGQDPLLGVDYQYETATSAAGTWQWHPVVGGAGDWHRRWYCASRPVTSPTDPAVTWLSPERSSVVPDPSV